jgi:hypothetical protein
MKFIIFFFFFLDLLDLHNCAEGFQCLNLAHLWLQIHCLMMMLNGQMYWIQKEENDEDNETEDSSLNRGFLNLVFGVTEISLD